MAENKTESAIGATRSHEESRAVDDAGFGEIHGRAIQQQEHERTYWQTLRKDPKLLGWIGLMLWMLIIRGFENQASGAVISITQFKRRFGVLQDGDYYIDTRWQSAISGGPQAMAIFGSWGASMLADRFGFKWVLIGASVINLSSFACALMANSVGSWETDWSWKSLICAQFGVAGVGFIPLFFMPESPVYLVRKGRIDAARHSLGRMYSLPSDADGHLEKISLTLSEAETLEENGSFVQCFKGTNLRRTMIALIVFVAQPMSGLGFVNSYGPLLYQLMGVSDQKSFEIQIGSQVLSISGTISSFLVSDFVGRRPIFFGGCISMTLLLFCLAIAGCFPEIKSASTAAVGFLTMYNFFFNFAVGSTAYVIAGEIPTSVLRNKTLALAICLESAVNVLWTFVCPYIINPGYGGLRAKVGFIFGAFMACWSVLAFLYVPETRLRTYEELDEMFMNHVPTRKFRKYVTEAERRAADSYRLEEKTRELEHVEHV